MGLIKGFTKFIDTQYKEPKGLLGMYIGEKMVRQHQPETSWTLSMLKLKQGENVLEIGCGAGYAMKLLLKQSKVNQVVGLDISHSVLQSAMIRNRKEINKGRAKLVRSNVNHLPFKDGHFTKIFSIHSVYFWDDLHESLTEIYRVMKSGGTMMITFCNGKNEETWSDIEQQITPIMNRIGFENIEWLNGPHSREFHTAAVVGEKSKV